MTKQTSVNRVSTRARERVLPVARRVHRGVKLGPDAAAGKVPDGFIEMHEVQAAYIGSGSGGAGVLSFRGVQYTFDVGGVGVGGIGLSTIEATGEVYNLRDLGQFPAPMARPAMVCDRHREWRRSLDAERGGRDPAPEGEAHGADVSPRGRRRRHLDAPVSGADAGVGKELCKIPDLIKAQFIVAEAG